MYVVSTWGKGACERNRHRHILWVSYGECNFTITEIHYEMSDKVEYSVDLGTLGKSFDAEEIVVVDSLGEAYGIIQDIIYYSSDPDNETAYYCLPDRKIRRDLHLT